MVVLYSVSCFIGPFYNGSCRVWFIIPLTQQSCWGVYWFHSVRPYVHLSVYPSIRPSIRPASHVRSVVPTVLVGSISYLYILSSNSGISERRCSSCSSCISWWSRVSKTASWTSRICQSFYSHLYVTCFVKLQVLKIRQLVWGLDSGSCQTSSKPSW